MLGWWHDVDGSRAHVFLAEGFVVEREANGDQFVFAERSLCIAVPAILRSPHEHVAATGCEEGTALLVGVFRHGGVELGIVINLEIDACAIHGTSLSVNDAEVGAPRRAVVVDEVDFCEVRCAQHHLFRTVVVAECTGVHEQCA